MTAHPHAALMMEYARDAAVNAQPWMLWECAVPASAFASDRDWTTCDHAIAWYPHWEYRRKPKLAECWVNVYAGGLGFGAAYPDKDEAEDARAENGRTIHMREVPNE